MKKTSRVKKRLWVFVCLMFCSISTVNADFEASYGFFFGWNNTDNRVLLVNGLGFGMDINIGWTKGNIVPSGYFITSSGEKINTPASKSVKLFDFDILLDLCIGIPIQQGGGIFNFYFFVPNDIFAMGVGIGSGWAINFSKGFKHGPYIRVNIPVILLKGPLGARFDYYFFKEHYFQIAGYFTILF